MLERFFKNSRRILAGIHQAQSQRSSNRSRRSSSRQLAVEPLENRCLLATHYVDSTSGDDTNAGTSEVAAWQTLARVEAATLAPGDLVLLKRGETFDEQFDVNHTGTIAAPITFGVYGTGDDPIIRRLRVNGLADFTVFEAQTREAH